MLAAIALPGAVGLPLVVEPGIGPRLALGRADDGVAWDVDEGVGEEEVLGVGDSELSNASGLLTLNPTEKPLIEVFVASFPGLSSLFSQANW